MATTTNYGWTTPDDTALVKDGASAIRSLGTAVDTTTKALNPSTTLGDIEYRSSTANTNTRLGIGTTGQILTVAGGVPSWATPTSASALTKITSATFTGQSSVAVDGCFTSTYKKYLCVWQALTNSNGADLQLQFRYAGPTTEVLHYYGSGMGYNRANSLSGYGFVDVAQTTIIPELNNTYYSFGNIYFTDVGNSSQYASYFGNALQFDTQTTCSYTGWQETARTYTGFLLKPSTGTITGTYQVYGLEN